MAPRRGATRNRLTLIVVLTAAFCSCARGERGDQLPLRVWSHHGRPAEHDAMLAIAAAFERARPIELTFFPDRAYVEKVSVAAAAGDLPDVLELDGPLVAKFAAAGLLAPLDEMLDERTRGDFLPTILEQGTVEGHLYALGAFESALVLYYDTELFARAGVAPPPPGAAWTWDELLHALEKLRTTDVAPIALHMNESADEWFTYAFSPVVWSAGGRLIDTTSNRVLGVLDSAVNIAALERWQQLFARSFASADPIDPDPFGSGRAAIDWTGHWMARSHLAKKGSRLAVMPLPRMGERSASTSGSWCWAIAAAAADRREAAFAWIEHVTDPAHGVLPIVRANGAVPSRRSAFALFDDFSRPPFSVFREELEHNARARPRTRHYATLTRHFAAALREIAHGADVAARLHNAAEAVQREIDRRERAR